MIKMLSKRRTTLVLFLEGFVSVSLQMLMMRQLVPFIGSSVVVSSLVVGFFLASLSIGYAVGGRVKENHIKRLSKNLIISALLLGVCVSYPVMKIAFIYLNEYINNPLIETSIVLSLFLAPAVFLLGQTVPLLTNFYKSSRVSEIAGDSFAINTIGSVLGSLITALVFFYFFGMAATVFIDVVLIGIVLCLLIDKSMYMKYGIAMFFILVSTYILNISYEKETFKLTNAYNNYEIVDETIQGELTKVLKMNRSYSSALKQNGKSWDYIENVKTIMFSHLRLENKEILILGAGGFTLSNGNKIPENSFTYIDIDPEIKEIAEKEFLNKKINGKFVAEDARVFVKKSKPIYDAIFVDLYSNKSTIPWHLLTKEFIQNIKGATKEKGVVIFNIISSGMFENEYGKNTYNTINSVFPYCHSMPLYFTENKVNILYICKNIKEDQKTVYVDDLSRSPFEEMRAKD
jgi:spermidine synthase